MDVKQDIFVNLDQAVEFMEAQEGDTAIRAHITVNSDTTCVGYWVVYYA